MIWHIFSSFTFEGPFTFLGGLGVGPQIYLRCASSVDYMARHEAFILGPLSTTQLTKLGDLSVVLADEYSNAWAYECKVLWGFCGEWKFPTRLGKFSSFTLKRVIDIFP